MLRKMKWTLKCDSLVQVDGEQDCSTTRSWSGADLHLQVAINIANLHEKDTRTD